MPRRNKNKKIDNTTLDLHGLKHQDVDRIVENHVFLTPRPHDIITGNSSEMHQIVKDVLERNGFLCQRPIHNFVDEWACNANQTLEVVLG